MQLNLGRFQQNGSCGYVLKPTALLNVRALAPRPHSSFPV